MTIATKSGRLILKAEKVAVTCSCCGCSENCCRTVTYSYMDTEPKGKWYDECPNVGQCGGDSGSCANAVLDGFIIEKFCKSSVQGKQIKATLRKNSTIDDFGSVAGISTDVNTCGQLGKFTTDHDITDEVVFEDDPDDPLFLLAKVPFQAQNASHGGPYGLSSVRICWCCIEEGDPPCQCCYERCTDIYATSGGEGTTTNTYTFPSEALPLEFFYDAYTVPDSFTVKFCGDTVLETGSVSGSGNHCLQKPAGCTSVEVTVEGPTGTAWGYTIKCECGPPPPPKYECRQGECVSMQGGPYSDPACGGECDTFGPCCTDYGLVYVKRSKCREFGGEFYEPDEEFDSTCGCDCTLGSYPTILTPSREPGYPPPNPSHCGPGANTGWSIDYNPVDDDFSSGFISFYCYGTFCDPIQSYFDRGARVIGWVDINQTRRTKVSTECCQSTANFTSYKYRTFAYNCRTKTWEEITNIMSDADAEYSNVINPDQYYLENVCGSWPNGFATPAEIRSTRDPYCETNPLP